MILYSLSQMFNCHVKVHGRHAHKGCWCLRLIVLDDEFLRPINFARFLHSPYTLVGRDDERVDLALGGGGAAET